MRSRPATATLTPCWFVSEGEDLARCHSKAPQLVKKSECLSPSFCMLKDVQEASNAGGIWPSGRAGHGHEEMPDESFNGSNCRKLRMSPRLCLSKLRVLSIPQQLALPHSRNVSWGMLALCDSISQNSYCSDANKTTPRFVKSGPVPIGGFWMWAGASKLSISRGGWCIGVPTPIKHQDRGQCLKS